VDLRKFRTNISLYVSSTSGAADLPRSRPYRISQMGSETNRRHPLFAQQRRRGRQDWRRRSTAHNPDTPATVSQTPSIMALHASRRCRCRRSPILFRLAHQKTRMGRRARAPFQGLHEQDPQPPPQAAAIESSGVAMYHYADVLVEKRLQYKWKYGAHYFPHDVKQKEWLSEKSRIESLERLGIEVTVVPDHPCSSSSACRRRTSQ
jgi:hypothetical protein